MRQIISFCHSREGHNKGERCGHFPILTAQNSGWPEKLDVPSGAKIPSLNEAVDLGLGERFSLRIVPTSRVSMSSLVEFLPW